MAVSIEKSCSMIVHLDKPGNANEIKAALEGNDDERKIEALKSAVAMALSGEQIPGLFICMIRYVLPSEDHTVQRLLLLYLETIEKTDQNGKLLPEMILICQNLRNNLQHPNEYIRGVTLRFLCRIHEEEILEPLVPSILANLEHRHSYVRRNAVLCLNEVYKLPKGDIMLQDAPELVENFLNGEQDGTARRNAFMFLSNHDPDRAVNYLSSQADKLIDWGAILQMAVLDLIRKVCRSKPSDKGKYIKIILVLLSSTKTAVVYECATTLVSLSQAPTAIRAAANCYCQLLVSQSDNNVKLIVLDRLHDLRGKHADVMQEMLMDVLRALSTPVHEIRRKTLELTMDLVTSKNINEVVMVLKKELMRTQDKQLERSGEYRQLLVVCIHKCAVKFPSVATTVVHLLMDFLGDSSTIGALDVAFFIREMMETNPKLRVAILPQLRNTFNQIRSTRVATTAMWILSEFSTSTEDVLAALDVIMDAVGPVPLFTSTADGADAASDAQSSTPVGKVRPAVLADGTYATQVAAAEVAAAPAPTPGASNSQNLRALLLAGDYYLGAVTSVNLVKLTLHLKKLGGVPVKEYRKRCAEAMLVMVGILRLGERPDAEKSGVDKDSADRIVTCLRVLNNPNEDVVDTWLSEGRRTYGLLLSEKRTQDLQQAEAAAAKLSCQPDDLIDFAHLKHRKGVSQIELEDEVQQDLARATGYGDAKQDRSASLDRMLQLTGLSDPVYAEALVTVHQYDIVLDVTVINRSKATMQQLCLELATMGDLKLVERPQNYTLAAGESRNIRANIKVSSTETGVIFGNIVYDTANVADRCVIVLNDIHIDIMDYIAPAVCSDVTFRNMWAEFEWENKVAINTDFKDPRAFLEHIVKSTNMQCLSSPSSMAGECGFLAANLYAKSVFGEDALVNMSLEQCGDGRLAGFMRIRAKTQGIALSLGDKITLKQRKSG